jgi:hypothetical protein
MIAPQEQEFRAKLKEVRDHRTKTADDAGQKFPEEARKMRHGEERDEGLEFHPLPDERN